MIFCHIVPSSTLQGFTDLTRWREEGRLLCSWCFLQCRGRPVSLACLASLEASLTSSQGRLEGLNLHGKFEGRSCSATVRPFSLPLFPFLSLPISESSLNSLSLPPPHTSPESKLLKRCSKVTLFERACPCSLYGDRVKQGCLQEGALRDVRKVLNLGGGLTGMYIHRILSSCRRRFTFRVTHH